MKRNNLFYCALFIAVFASCNVLQPPVKLYSNSLDYTTYQKNGFFITEASSVNFEYSPISSVSATLYSGFVKVGKKGHKPTIIATKYKDDVYGAQSTPAIWGRAEFVPATREVVLEELYNKATENGADGIINLKIGYFRYGISKEGYEEGYEASGMAIKRK
jgi:hypothetical protein